MDYTWGVPVQQAIMQQNGYGNYNQYPQHFTGYEPYYMGHPWAAGSYAPMYHYGMQGHQQMAHPTKQEILDMPPAAKRARLEYPKEDFSNQTSEILNADEFTAVPDSFELQIDTNHPKDSEHNGSIAVPDNLELNQSNIVNPHGSTQAGPLTSTLVSPLPPVTISPPLTSPIKHGDHNSLTNNQTHDENDQQEYTVKQSDQEQPTYIPAIYTEQYVSQHHEQDQPIATAPFEASQVMVMLPNGSKSSIWDLQVPAAFASYQQPSSYYPNAISAPGPSRKRRSTGPRTKNNYCHLCEKSYESSYKLKLHMNAHTGERPFVCEICGKGFARGPNLNAHRRVHTGEKPFSCNRCSRGFSHPSDRIVHMVTEVCVRADRYIRRTGQGWECTSCDSGAFESREQAERHARQHETGKGLCCPVCQANFQGQKAFVLVKHVREYHPEYMNSIGL